MCIALANGEKSVEAKRLYTPEPIPIPIATPVSKYYGIRTRVRRRFYDDVVAATATPVNTPTSTATTTRTPTPTHTSAPTDNPN